MKNTIQDFSHITESDSKPSTLVELLEQRALHQPDKQAYTFMVDGKVEGQTLTYAQLHRQARAIASWLQKHKAQGERVLLLFPQSLEVIAAFYGCLYAGAIAIPAPAPEASRLKRTLPRLQAIAKDAQASFVLTTSEIISLVGEGRHQIKEFQAMEWLATEEVELELADHWQDPGINSDQIAYLQYTSGSTSTPKGVMITHENILFHCAYLQKACGYTPDSVTVTWMPYFHDYGLVEGLTEPLYNGTPCYVMSPFAFLRRPFHWLQTISRYKGTHSQAPNFAYDQCVRRITPEQRAQLDLSCWRAAGNAAEPINPKVLESFLETFTQCGFRPEAFSPAYGLAEATLLVSSSPETEAPVVLNLEPSALEKDQIVEASNSSQIVRQVSGCGRLVCDTNVAIVNPQTLTRCAPDRVGEIWVSDKSVAQGYWQRPEETKRTFQAQIADTVEGPFLRTGDLGFIKDGQLFVTGRLKDVIIIRGTNHYPQDIEWTVQNCYSGLRPENGAAFSVEVNKEEQLVILQEVERSALKDLDADRVFETIRKEIFENHEIQVYAVLLIKSGTIPKTSSGKIQRSKCRQGFIEDTLSIIASWKSPMLDSGVSTNDGKLGLHKNSLYNGTPVARLSINNNSMANNNSSQTTAAKTDELIGWLRNYANERVNSQLLDERRCIPPYIVLDIGNRGLLGMQVPPEQGGLGLNNSDSMRIMEQLGAIDLNIALVVFNHNILGLRPILKYGAQPMRDEMVPILATGRELAAFAVSEPGAGSNPRGISTKAIPEGDGVWRLEGTKYWSGMAAWAGVINVFAQTLNHKGEPQGISGFAVRQGTPGLRQGPEALTLGMRGMIQNTIYLEGARVSHEQLLGSQANGMEAAQDAMMYGRLVIGAFSLGGMKRCAQLMLRYATRRSISTGRLLDNPVTLARLGELNAEITGLEVLISGMTKLLDQGWSIPVEPYIVCKVAGAEFFWKATDRLIQMLGGRGYVEPNIAPQLLRDARVCRIFEGPTETLNMFLGSRVINKSEELHKFLCEALKAPAISQSLRTAAEQIQERCLGNQSPFQDRAASVRWASALAGEVATYAIFWAILQQANEYSGSERLRRAIEWAQLNFEQTRAKALAGVPSEAILSNADVTTALISDYSQAIGDIEQTLAGEDRELDAFLRLERDKPQVKIEVPTEIIEEAKPVEDVVVEASESDSTHTVVSIQTWIVDLLNREWRIPSESIVPNKSFADYGLDSVMAVSLAQELEDWLGHVVEATIVWNFPTIESLAKHLASELNKPESTQEDEEDKSSEFESQSEDNTTVEDLDLLSDNEMAQLLASEIATAKQRK
ncbi:MAG: AMP-binding protein [Cyanobacteria bacterium P01_D01_bin.50]